MKSTIDMRYQRTCHLVLLVSVFAAAVDWLPATAQDPTERTPSRPTPTEPVLLAHRGLARHAPENTLPAFAAAIALDLSIELDVYQTRDGHLGRDSRSDCRQND